MTQTPRDWQKDMEMFEEANKAALTWLVGKEAAEAGVYWLQEAKRHMEAWKVLAKIKAGDMHPSELKEFAKQMLKGEAPYKLNEGGPKGYDATELLSGSGGRKGSTLYPDTPAPTPTKADQSCHICGNDPVKMMFCSAVHPTPAPKEGE